MGMTSHLLPASVLVSLIAAGPYGAGTLPEEPAPVSACTILADQALYIGKLVTFSAHYSTDSAHYGFLADPTCRHLGSIDIGYVVPEADASVSQFEQKQVDTCRARGQSYLCILEGELTVAGRIVRGGPRQFSNVPSLLINLHSVQYVTFADER
jgi:hypothetical protein